jgi:transposase-like protein
MSRLTNDKKRALGEQMFIENMRTSKYIAEYLGVSEQTVSRWRKKYDWDKRRTEALASPHRIKSILFRELENIAEGNDKTIEADGLYKIFKVIEGLSDRTSVQVVLSVFKEFDDWMIDQDPDMAIKFLEYHKKFILFKAEQQ